MITLIEVMQAICSKLTNLLPDVPIQSSDIEEGFSSPSLFVEFPDTSTSSYISGKRERIIEVLIYYFPSNRYQNEIELLEKQDLLEEAFRHPFAITKGFFVYPVDVSSEIVDKVLQTTFEIQLLENNDHDIGAGDNMKHLNIDLRKEG